jgi:hypothetical protein
MSNDHRPRLCELRRGNGHIDGRHPSVAVRTTSRHGDKTAAAITSPLCPPSTSASTSHRANGLSTIVPFTPDLPPESRNAGVIILAAPWGRPSEGCIVCRRFDARPGWLPGGRSNGSGLALTTTAAGRARAACPGHARGAEASASDRMPVD